MNKCAEKILDKQYSQILYAETMRQKSNKQNVDAFNKQFERDLKNYKKLNGKNFLNY